MLLYISTRGRFHKIWAHGANHRDSSIQALSICALRPTFTLQKASQKLSATLCALRPTLWNQPQHLGAVNSKHWLKYALFNIFCTNKLKREKSKKFEVNLEIALECLPIVLFTEKNNVSVFHMSKNVLLTLRCFFGGNKTLDQCLGASSETQFLLPFLPLSAFLHNNIEKAYFDQGSTLTFVKIYNRTYIVKVGAQKKMVILNPVTNP